MLTIKIETKELTKLITHVEQFRHALENRQKPLKEAKKHQVERWAQNFDQEGQIYGGWTGLSDTWTQPEREDLGYGASTPILKREGTLRTHFITQNKAGEVTNQAVGWNMTNKGGPRGAAGSTVSMHEGYKNPIAGKKAIPRRKLWDIDPTDEKAIAEMLEKWADEVIAKYFGGS